MHQNCSECTRLWNEYALATRHFLNIEGKLKTAGVSHDDRAVLELAPAVERAAAERANIRRLIEQHEGQVPKNSETAAAPPYCAIPSL
jgi:hypothetical protein